ncbi:VOC family protein [Hoeflea sp.]|uniref:VOC family protein n=1 Tax=Hoeflea sp. TaxID=1940281 RepID=UPI003B01D496
MRFVNPLPFVKDIAASKAFYRDVMSLRVTRDHGDFVQFESGFALHDGGSLLQTIFGRDAQEPETYGSQNLVLYFEVDDIEDAFNRIEPNVDLIHPIEEQNWGQMVFRFYDPDGHMVEAGESQ